MSYTLSLLTAVLDQEYMASIKSPTDRILLAPRPENILEWRFVIMPPDDSVFAGQLPAASPSLFHCGGGRRRRVRRRMRMQF